MNTKQFLSIDFLSTLFNFTLPALFLKDIPFLSYTTLKCVPLILLFVSHSYLYSSDKKHISKQARKSLRTLQLSKLQAIQSQQKKGESTLECIQKKPEHPVHHKNDTAQLTDKLATDDIFTRKNKRDFFVVQNKDGSFSTIIALTVLILSHNKLTSFPKESFSHLSYLEELDLSDNQLTTLPDMCKADLPNLKTLLLSRNKLTSETVNQFPVLPLLKELYLDNNQITEFPDVSAKPLEHLRYIDLSDNLITNIDYAKILASTRRLETTVLNMENNPVENPNNPTLLGIIFKREDRDRYRGKIPNECTLL